jgi:hypothetical protein
MPRTPTRALLASAAIVAALTLPSPASSQYRLPTITSVARADSLHESAVALSSDFRRLRDAARLHEQSAALRAPEDSLAFRCLTTAAQLSYAKKDLADAQRDMAAAAAHALARGDIQKSAQAFADAAWLADARQHRGEVRSLARQAEMLAASPLLSGPQRVAILKRFVHTGREMASDER